jgi:RNA polymerase sigma-70 factor (ECF subfamily)
MMELYDRFSPRLYGLIIGLLHDHSSANDVLQEVMVSLWKSAAARYDPALGSAESWLLMLARSRAIDHLRSVARTKARTQRAGEQEVIQQLAAPRPTEGAALADLRRLLATLPGELQQPILLAYAHGMSREEIASQLNIPVGTVKTRISRGVDRLRDLVG